MYLGLSPNNLLYIKYEAMQEIHNNYHQCTINVKLQSQGRKDGANYKTATVSTEIHQGNHTSPSRMRQHMTHVFNKH